MSAGNMKDILDAAAERLRDSPTARRDAELLLMRAVGRDRAWLLTHPNAEPVPQQLEKFETWVERRTRHEPVQYILGESKFYGLTLRVTPAVLIPRPETEHLVEAVLARVPRSATMRICDVGTGSGAIAVALAQALPSAGVTALDISAVALSVAKENAQRHGVAGRMRFVESDLLGAVRGDRFDVVVSNPPYVAQDEVLEAQVRDFEPQVALFAGKTGLEIYERLIPQTREILMPDGWLFMEIGHGQRDALANLLSDWDAVEFVADLQGIPRVAIAQRRA
jgi:release factor glutamine methyltransferase